MKILLLGATGRTGRLIIKEAIKRGHKISAIARDPEKLKDYQIEITQGTPYNFETVEKALSGCESVISSWKTTPAILKLIVSLSNLKYAFRDHGRQEEILQNTSIDYTICRAPMLSSEISTKGAVAVKEDENPPKMVLNRNSAAAFFIKIIENKEYVREVVNISNNPD